MHLAVDSAVNNEFKQIGWLKLKTVPLAVSPGAVWRVWLLWSSSAFFIRHTGFDHMRFIALPCSLWFMEGTALPNWNQNLLCSLQLSSAYTLILPFEIQKAEKVHEKNASRDGTGGVFQPSFMDSKEWYFPCVMSPWICLNIENWKSRPQAPQPVEDHPASITWSSSVSKL